MAFVPLAKQGTLGPPVRFRDRRALLLRMT